MPMPFDGGIQIIGPNGTVDILCMTCMRPIPAADRQAGFLNDCRDCHERKTGTGKYAAGGGGFASAGLPMIRIGSTGPSVAYCQNLLNARLPPPPLWVDGIFGPKTDASVRTFQMSRQLMVDGIVGPQTWAALEAGPPPISRRPG